MTAPLAQTTTAEMSATITNTEFIFVKIYLFITPPGEIVKILSIYVHTKKSIKIGLKLIYRLEWTASKLCDDCG